jgi:hypothetical protein
MALLQMPQPLSPRVFHSKAKVDRYNEQVAAYLAQQAEIEYQYKQNLDRRHPSRRERFEELN